MNNENWISILEKRPPLDKLVKVLLSDGREVTMLGNDVLFNYYTTHWQSL